MSDVLAIPKEGADRHELLERMQSFRKGDASWKSGRTFSLVYFGGEEYHDFLVRAHNVFFAENALNPMAFKSLKRMEAEAVRMTATMLHGDERAVGTLTSGGTESILLAVKTYRDRARKRWPWIRHPEIVAPETVHVAFDKAAHYFGVTIRYVPVRADYRADVEAMRRAIGRNTVMLAASAPQYPHGVVDPIVEIGALAEKKNLPLHVDACIGGFVLPWLEKAGHAIPVWDFRVPGVTSISADLHKYGLSAKGASVIAYRSMDYLRHQFFVSTDWSGGIYASPSMPGTRGGGPIAAAWAALMATGEDGYTMHAKRAMEAARRLQEGVGAIPGLCVVGQPDATLVAVAGEPGVDVYAVGDQLEDMGWNVDRQQNPSCIHHTLMSHHLPIVEDYLGDLARAAGAVRSNPALRSRGNAAMYGMMARIPFRGMVRQGVLQVMEQLYGERALAAPDAGPELGKRGAERIALELLEKYGDSAQAVLDRVHALRTRLHRGGRRGR